MQRIRTLALLTALTVLLVASPSLALTRTVVLPELEGEYAPSTRTRDPSENPPNSRSATIDLGVEWRSIDSITISALGHGTFARLGRATDPKEAHQLIPPGLLIQIDREGSLPIRLPFASLEFGALPTWESTVAEDPRGAPPYDFALDGEIRMTVFLSGFAVSGIDPPTLFDQNSMFVKRFEISVTGQPVPEPGAGLLLLGGLAGLTRWQKP